MGKEHLKHFIRSDWISSIGCKLLYIKLIVCVKRSEYVFEIEDVKREIVKYENDCNKMVTL